MRKNYCNSAVTFKSKSHEGLPHLEVREDGSDVFFKTHIYHPVSFIQSQVATDVQTHHLLLQQVHQSSRCSNHHMDAALTKTELERKLVHNIT